MEEKLARREEVLQESREKYRILSESLEQKVREKVVELRQAERLATMGQMISVVAHEIRNPLQNITMALEEIRNAIIGNDKLAETLNAMETGVNSLNRLARDILEYSRPVSLKIVPCPVEAIVQRALEMLAHRLDGYTLALDLQNKEQEVLVDSGKLAQVLVNLISNAVEAMPQGGTITVSSCIAPQGNRNFLFLSVSDTGAGITEENLERIHDPFFTTKSRGTGLGLSICKKIIEAHQGVLWLHSRLGEGTTAEICLPAAPPPLH
jgi:signal transduction histidine kinase